MEPHRTEPHVPGPSLWPVGFAIGIACLLVGLIVSWLVAAVGAAIAILFAFLWIRDLTTAQGLAHAPEVEPETRAAAAQPAVPANVGEAALPPPEPGERFPRNVFLEGATLGLGAVIGGLVTVPALGFAVLPPFLKQGHHSVDLGPLTDFPQGQYVVATFMEDPSQGEVSRRTAFVRNNGLLNGEPSFTIISNHCAHLGCPVQPNGPLFEDKKKEHGNVSLIPTQPAGFGCPCHGGQYDTEGNRIAGPPVRALDRYSFSVRNGHLFVGNTFSVSHVDNSGSAARIHKYGLRGPGEHVDGPEAWFYPIQIGH